MASVSPRTNGPLNDISLEGGFEDGDEITGDDGQTYTVTKKKKPQTLSEMAQEEARKEGVSQLKQTGKQVVAAATGRATAGQALSSIDPTTLPEGQVVNMGGPATPDILGANAIDGAGNVTSTGAPVTSGFELSGIGSAGNYILPAAGLAGAYDLWANKPQNVGHGSGYLQGAASGAAMGSYFGPWGAGIGAGLGLAANAFGIGGESRTKVEEDRRKALAEQGINVPNYDQKEWELNEAFKGSRNEADLKGGDIENAAQFYGIQGYSQADQAKKEAIAQKAIDDKLIREHHGTIDLSMTPEYEAYLKEQLGGGDQTSGGVDTRRLQAENKKQRKKQALATLLPEIMSTPTTGPRYDQNPGSLINNPYL